MVISSRTPEGMPNHCPVCGADLKIEPSHPPGDAPCPRCGHLLWFTWDDLGDFQVIRPTDNLSHPELLDGLFELLNAVLLNANNGQQGLHKGSPFLRPDLGKVRLHASNL